jgi:small subunit ribosomal protein S6
VPFRSRLTYGVERDQTQGKEDSSMRKYELICVFQPELDETGLNDAVEKVKDWITESGGDVEKVDVWGKRKLAYLIRKQHEGQYVLLNLNLPSDATTELERNLRFMEPVLRHMLTLV